MRKWEPVTKKSANHQSPVPNEKDRITNKKHISKDKQSTPQKVERMEMDAFLERMIDETYGYEDHEQRKSPKKMKNKIVFMERDIIPKGNFESNDTKKSKKKEKKGNDMKPLKNISFSTIDTDSELKTEASIVTKLPERNIDLLKSKMKEKKKEIFWSNLLHSVDDSVIVKKVKKKKKVPTEQQKEDQGVKIIEDSDLTSGEPTKKKKKKETGNRNVLLSENSSLKETKKEKKKKLKIHETSIKDAKSKVKVTEVKVKTSDVNTAEVRVISNLFDEPADWDAPLLPEEQVNKEFNFSTSDWNAPLLPGEQEIVMPNKKYKGNQKLDPALVTKEFDSSTNKKKKRKRLTEDGGAPRSKRVNFVLSRNMSQDISDLMTSIASSPGTPHDPRKNPVKSLLKRSINNHDRSFEMHPVKLNTQLNSLSPTKGLSANSISNVSATDNSVNVRMCAAQFF